jgi:soluble lytic murein transglycosylase-like protein
MLAIMAATSPVLAAETSHQGTAGVQLAANGEGTLTAAILPGADRAARVAPLPRPLSAADADAYSKALQLQAQGQTAAADRELGRVRDEVLKGYVLAQRYLAAGTRPKYQELRAWMADYADQPEAEAVYKLATSKGVKGFGAIKQPVRGYLKGTGIDTSDDGAAWGDATFSSEGVSPKARALKAKLRQAFRDDEPGQAAALLAGVEGHGLEREELDQLRTMVAVDHFAGGRDDEAVAWAEQAIDSATTELPTAHWVAGLALWRMGKPEQARRHFEDVANASDASGWMVAAGAFWAARANLVSKRPEVVNHWLEQAATYPRTFYGLLARQALGYASYFSWETPPFTEADADILLRVPGGRRALALLQLGNSQAAEEQLRKAYPNATKAVRQSMLVLAHAGAMPGLAVRLGGMMPGDDGRLQDAAAFPVPEWQPKGGWVVDKALVYAFVRQESAFNPRARSSAGAHGLMQLMPATAASVAGGRQSRDRLADPEVNLGLGQRYLSKLLGEDPVNGNLFMLAAAYNAGPGNLSRWQQSIRHNGDPLLFIESIPSRQTRTFVQRVMTNYWIYKARMGETAASLDAVAAGDWPIYEGLDQARTRNKTVRN